MTIAISMNLLNDHLNFINILILDKQINETFGSDSKENKIQCSY
jgi:hypothetical protein